MNNVLGDKMGSSDRRRALNWLKEFTAVLREIEQVTGELNDALAEWHDDLERKREIEEVLYGHRAR